MVGNNNSLLQTGDKEVIVNALSLDCAPEVTERSLILLYLEEGLKSEQIARTLKVTASTVSYWRKRYLDHGVAALNIAGERNTKRSTTSAELIRKILDKTENELPETGRRWTTRSMAQAIGVSDSTVRRVWQNNGVAPHLASHPGKTECLALGEECDNVLRLVARQVVG